MKPEILGSIPSIVGGSVAGISPLLQGRNGYLPSIGWKGTVPGGEMQEK